MIRTQIQSQHLKISYDKMMSILVNGVRVNGIKSLWRGLVPTLLRDVPLSGIYWSLYETMKPIVTGSLFRGDSSHDTKATGTAFGPSFISGALSGMMAAALTHPFDVVKTHRPI